MRTITTVMLVLICCNAFGVTHDEVINWREDIDYYSENLIANHIDPFHSISKEDFQREVKRIKNSLGSKTENQVIVELMRLTRRINDGHTSFPLWGSELTSFPLELKIFGDDLYVIKSTKDNSDIVGAKLVGINGFPSAEIINLFSQITPFSENKFSTAVRVAEYVPKAEVLNGLGIIGNFQNVPFEFEVEGKLVERKLTAVSSPLLVSYISYSPGQDFLPVEEINKDLWFGASLENETVYLKFRRYPSMSKMESFAEDLLSFVRKNRSRNLIIDLRDNYGGDFFIGLKLAQLLVLADSIDWKSGVYILIDNVTFSAAMSNAAQFSQILNGKLVGAPTGAQPSGYQDMGQFTLPNAGLEVTYSKRLYRFAEGQRDALYPDENVEVSIEDYKNGYDRQLRWILSDIKLKKLK